MDRKKLSRLFELRSVVGVLFGIFGAVCLVWGLAFTTEKELQKAAGVNVNLWAGAAMLVFAAAFIAWAMLGAAPEEAAPGDAAADADAGEGDTRQ